jgi:hypothetical protein
MVAESLTFAQTARPREEARAVPRGLAVEVDSCEGLPVEHYKWHVGRQIDPFKVYAAGRALLFVTLHRSGIVHSGRIPSTCGTLDTREQAVGACRDEFDYIYREPHGVLKSQTANGTEDKCFPLRESDQELNARDALRFAHERHYYRAKECEESLARVSLDIADLKLRVAALEGRR